MIARLSKNRYPTFANLSWKLRRFRQFCTPPVLLILTTVVGLASCQTLHHFGSNNPDLAISRELANHNPIAWLMLASLAATILLAMRFYIETKSPFQVGLNGFALLNFAIVALTTHGAVWHCICLLTGISCLAFSTFLLSFRAGILLGTVIVSSMFASLFVAALFIVSGSVGWAEKAPYVCYTLTTAWILCFGVGWTPREKHFDGIVEGRVISRKFETHDADKSK